MTFSRFVSCSKNDVNGILLMREVTHMDQMKIGAFLKKLRKEKNLTQEQLAEQFNVSGRTVSRWETDIPTF